MGYKIGYLYANDTSSGYVAMSISKYAPLLFEDVQSLLGIFDTPRSNADIT